MINQILGLSREGFTLVELMVVVSIVGILAAIAIPQYSRFQAKARQAEAKVSLASVYSVEQAYFAETGSYGATLVNMGFVPPVGGKRFYTFGFFAGTSFPNFCTKLDGTRATCDTVPYNGAAAGSCVAGTCHFMANAATNGMAVLSPPNLGFTLTQADKFTAQAEGYVSTGTVQDRWTLNQDKTLANVVDGL